MSARGVDARRLLRQFRAGVLSTHSEKVPGYPYGAALPFCTDAQGRVVVLISHLAEHTRNVELDPRVSFTVSPMSPDLQTAARATLLGKLSPVEDEAIAARYLRFFPEGRDYLAIGGFRFWILEPLQVRLIAGFGSLHWIDGASLLAGVRPLAGAETGIIEHMNADHRPALLDYCRHVHGLRTASAEMAGIDCDGFDVRADDRLLRFDFDGEIDDAGAARERLVALARAARA
jgi:heme iron utilization protein